MVLILIAAIYTLIVVNATLEAVGGGGTDGGGSGNGIWKVAIVNSCDSGKSRVPIIFFPYRCLFSKMITELLWTTIFLQTAFTSEITVLTNMYIRCCDNDLYVGSVLDTVIVRSTLHCAAVCSWSDRCQEINICPRDGSLELVDCNLHGDSSLQDGNSLKYDISQDCLRMKKVSDLSNELL